MNVCSIELAVGPEWHESEGMCEIERVNATLAISRLRTTTAFCLLTTASYHWYDLQLTLPYHHASRNLFSWPLLYYLTMWHPSGPCNTLVYLGHYKIQIRLD